jgi:hypothetical protein
MTLTSLESRNGSSKRELHGQGCSEVVEVYLGHVSCLMKVLMPHLRLPFVIATGNGCGVNRGIIRGSPEG